MITGDNSHLFLEPRPIYELQTRPGLNNIYLTQKTRKTILTEICIRRRALHKDTTNYQRLELNIWIFLC